MDPSDIHPGLEGIAVAETRLSRINGENETLIIAGFPVGELTARATYEESVHLLLRGRLPARTELEGFRSKLARRRRIGPEVRALLQRAAREERRPA